MHFILDNYILIIIMMGLLIMCYKNKNIDNISMKGFPLLILFIAISTISDALEYKYSSYPNPTIYRYIFSIICYSIKPVIILQFMRIITNRRKVYYLLPFAIINALIYLTSLFTDIAFTFGPQNNFIRGPLGYSCHILSFIYMLICIVLLIKRHRKRDFIDTIYLYFIVISSALTAYLDTMCYVENMLDYVLLINVTFFYLYMFIDSNKLDPLTNSYNRKTFYEDITKYGNKITGVMSIDMNGLKYINDTFGHDEGDKAIIEISNTLNSVSSDKYIFYRIGGDEFACFCINQNKTQINNEIKKIENAIKKTKYTCSIGFQYKEKGLDAKEMYTLADEKMYINKKKFYKEKGISKRNNYEKK